MIDFSILRRLVNDIKGGPIIQISNNFNGLEVRCTWYKNGTHYNYSQTFIDNTDKVVENPDMLLNVYIAECNHYFEHIVSWE